MLPAVNPPLPRSALVPIIPLEKRSDLRILLTTGKLTYSNPTTYTLQLIRGLLARGHKVMVATLGGPLLADLEDLGVEVFLMKFNLFSYRRLLQFFREFGPNLIHATGGSQALQVATRLSRKLETPMLHTIHSWLPEDRGERLPPDLAGIIVVNQSLREHLVNDQRVPKNMIRVIPYGVDTELHAPAEHHSKSTVPVVGVVGRLERGRRYDDFLSAAKVMLQRGEEVHFIIAGEGPDEARLRQLARQMGLEKTVTFVQPQASVLQIYSVIDLLVIVADWGGVGLNLLEGMAHGCAVIATGGGEVYSVLGEERTCMVVPAGNTAELANQISGLLADDRTRKELGENAREHVLRNYPVEDQIVRVEKYYEQVLAETVA